MSQLINFGAGIYLLIGFLIVLAGTLFVLLGGWTALKVYIWSHRAKESESKARERRAGPAIGRGVCTACLRAADEVYHVSPGVRVCAPCYEKSKRRNVETSK